ncbi:MAG: Na(+)-translocating NADH-quinone reductase subunit A [Planctomycetales bacterium]|nr:Na(+)-translocating NADH-quinone reductase subunit A [Planctomycetales bacterium]
MIERIEISRGLDVAIAGEPEQSVDVKDVGTVGLVADDYVGMRPTLLVSEGDQVELGQPVFSDKKSEGVVFTAPASGTVRSINRGAKRRFLSLIIDKSDSQTGRAFSSYDAAAISGLDRQLLTEQLVASGLWSSFRQRPFSKVPSPTTSPQAIFINAMDSNPLAADAGLIIAARQEEFVAGAEVVAGLTDGKVFLCRRPGSGVPGESIRRVQVAEFAGPHPAGLSGTHMHFLKPASVGRTNWYLNYQDVIAIGHLFLSGSLDPNRVIALGGPSVKRPRLLRVPMGASLDGIVAGELSDGDVRVVSGSVLCGRKNEELIGFLGRYHLQVSCLLEGKEREFLGWQMPGVEKYSATRAFAAAWLSPKKFALTTSTGGSERAMVPIGTYEKVVPLDMLPTLLLRSLISRDTATAQQLGCLELDEEDLGLCTFVCPGKYEYGEILRDNLLTIEKEG